MTTIEAIYNAVKAQLGNKYTVLSSYDATEDVNPSGCIAVNVGEFEKGTCNHDGCTPTVCIVQESLPPLGAEPFLYACILCCHKDPSPASPKWEE